MKSNIIAIGGFKGTGKDTAAHMLLYMCNMPKIFHSYFWYKIFAKFSTNGKYSITSFAYPLKRTLSALLDIDIKKFEDRDFKENYYIYFPTLDITNSPDKDMVISEGKFSRMVNNKDLSFLKTNYITIRQLLQVFGTECMRNIFGDKLWILSTLKHKKPIIISDLRFRTEWEVIHELGGKTLVMLRDECTPGSHVSEKEIQELIDEDKFDFYVNNNVSFKDLFNQLKWFYAVYQRFL